MPTAVVDLPRSRSVEVRAGGPGQSSHITVTEDGLPADAARIRLQDEESESATIDAALEHLLLQGYLCEG